MSKTKRFEGGIEAGAYVAEVEAVDSGYAVLVEFPNRSFGSVALARIERRAAGGYSVRIEDGYAAGAEFARVGSLAEAVRRVVWATNYSISLVNSNPF